MQHAIRGSLVVTLVSLAVAVSGESVSAQKAATTPAPTSSRSDETDARTERETETTEPREEGRLKGLARRVSAFASPTRGNETGLSASAGIIVAGSGLAGGAGYRRLNVAGSGLDVELDARLSVRMYQDYRAAIGLLGARSTTLELDTADSKFTSLFNTTEQKAPGSSLYIDVRFRDYPQHTYYGTGIGALEDNRSDYALSGMSVEGVWQRQVTAALGVSARGGWMDLGVGPGQNDSILDVDDRFPPSAVPGATEQPGFVTFGAAVAHDTRTLPGAPADGRFLGFAARRYSAMNSPELSFTRLTADARAYRQWPSTRGVIAVRGLVSADLTRDNASTPFYLQQSLGGGDTLRGFHSYRFPDQALAHATVEYRWRAHRYVELVPFYDVGTVAPGLSHLSLSALKASPGIGFRARNDRRSFARLDWAWSAEGQRVTLGIGPAF